VGLPFDAIDIVLGYQGLPTASLGDFANSGSYGRPISGHSLGTLDAINAYGFGLAIGGGRLDSVPFGNVASTALQVNLGTGDLVNGGVFGKMFNPGARLCSMGPTGHPQATYRAVCP
jgi:filamentous hemagglutinin